MTTSCYRNYSLDVNPGCDAGTDWLNAPGTCRLRIKNFNNADWTNSTLCTLARAGAVAVWDGTFSLVVPIVFPTPGNSYEIDLGTFQTCGGVYLGSSGTSFLVYYGGVPKWRLQISYMDTGLGDQLRWLGDLAGTSPIGIYPQLNRCNAGLPASIEIEGYPL